MDALEEATEEERKIATGEWPTIQINEGFVGSNLQRDLEQIRQENQSLLKLKDISFRRAPQHAASLILKRLLAPRTGVSYDHAGWMNRRARRHVFRHELAGTPLRIIVLLTFNRFLVTFPHHMTTSITILLADDHAVVRAGIRQFLESAADLSVIAEADDGDSARRLIAKHRPDVAVLDVQMPKSTGIEVARWCRAEHPTTGVLILTAYDDTPYVQAALAAGANGYVLKTAPPSAMIQAVRDVYEGKQVLDPAIRARAVTSDFIYEPLSEREVEVLSLAARGYTNKAISAQLFISDRTVQGHLAHIYAKLQTNTRTEAVMRAVSLGLIAP